VGVCFVVSTTSAQKTTNDDFLYAALWCHDMADRLLQLQTDVDQLKNAARSKTRKAVVGINQRQMYAVMLRIAEKFMP